MKLLLVSLITLIYLPALPSRGSRWLSSQRLALALTDFTTRNLVTTAAITVI